MKTIIDNTSSKVIQNVVRATKHMRNMSVLCGHCLGGDYKTLLEEKAIATIRTYIEIMYM